MEFTAEMDVCLLQAMSSNCRLVGIHRHFRMMQVLKAFNKRSPIQLTAEDLWRRIESLWNLPMLDALDQTYTPGSELEFENPRLRICQLYGNLLQPMEFSLFPPEDYMEMIDQRIDQRTQDNETEEEGKLPDEEVAKSSKSKRPSGSERNSPLRQKGSAAGSEEIMEPAPTKAANTRRSLANRKSTGKRPSREVSPAVSTATSTATTVNSKPNKRLSRTAAAAAVDESPPNKRKSSKQSSKEIEEESISPAAAISTRSSADTTANSKRPRASLPSQEEPASSSVTRRSQRKH